MNHARLLLTLVLALPALSMADEKPHFSVMFKPLSTETAIQETAFQALNVVDTLQTIQIAKNPTCYSESGTLELFTGSHPSTRGAVAGGIAFGAIHYAVTRGIENLVDENPDYRIVQRVWQYAGIILKGAVVYNNNRIGLGLNSSRLDPSRGCK